MSDCDACDAAIAILRKRLEGEQAKARSLHRNLDTLRAALEVGTVLWAGKLDELQRQNADLQAANTALLLRAREAEMAQLEAEAEIEARDERDADLALEMKNERD